MRGPEHDPALPGERAPVLLLQAGRHVRHVGVHRRPRALASFPQPYAPDEKTVSGFLSESLPCDLAPPEGALVAGAHPRPGDDAHHQPHEDPQDEHLDIWSTASLLPPLLPL